MIVRTINFTLLFGVILFVASANVIPRQPTSADETFARVAADLGINSADQEPAKPSIAASNPANAAAATTDEEDYSDGCLIEQPEYNDF